VDSQLVDLHRSQLNIDGASAVREIVLTVRQGPKRLDRNKSVATKRENAEPA
jgi:hypothetical protein